VNPRDQSSYIELNTKQFSKNVAFVRKQLKDGVELSAVVKGNAYGHGIEQFVPMAEKEGVGHFSVYGIEEAVDFHKVARPESQLMIMGFLAQENIEWTIRKGYEFFVYDLYELELAVEAAKKLERAAQIHVELETGMNRTGVDEVVFPEFVKVIKENSEHLKLCGLCTHYAGAESITNYYRITHQIKKFKEYQKYFKDQGLEFDKFHTACSAAVMRYPDTQMDLVRVGILLYGLWPSRETLIDYNTKTETVDDPLTGIISWKTSVMTLKEVQTGEYIGYGTSFLANRPTRIAVVPVGYGYGYARALSNQGRVLINGQRVAVIGTVNMNMMAIDVTEIKNVKHGDEVVVIGIQGKNRISVSSFGELSSQMNYELLARLPHNIPRIIID
jgi:alanine racemase